MPSSHVLKTRNRYAVCVGINHYATSAEFNDLHYAEQDTQAVYELFLEKGFAREHCCLLLGENATAGAISEALNKFVVTESSGDDLVVFYFSGYSLQVPIFDENKQAVEAQGDVILIAYDFDPRWIMKERGGWQGYPLQMRRLRTEVLEMTDAQQVLFVFDICYSGSVSGPQYRKDRLLSSQNLAQALVTQSAGRVVISSGLIQQKSREDDKLGHGLFTYHLLEALEGRTPDAMRGDGSVTIGSLFEYLAKQLPRDQQPIKSGIEDTNFQLFSFPSYAENRFASKTLLGRSEKKLYEKEVRLRAMLADHSGFMRDRLESFVGRETELVEIQRRIQEKLQTGGYVTITGQAGQGKSSVIAQLVEEYGTENVAFHFIPFNPGPDHQVGLLRNLMARLILKYDLSDLYLASESRAALRDYFSKVLGEVVAKGGREVIFIDGLDQLKEESNGLRDLSFLTNNPPPGVVFVLGTRPNDTLRPLELLKPRQEYKLPNLSRQDFDLILQHRHVQLDAEIANQFYHTMGENALYLDLVAKELAQKETVKPEDLIKRLADNPENIFSLSIARLKRQTIQWRAVIKPLLGLLLAAREPLTRRDIQQIIKVDKVQLADGLDRLGGLIAHDGQQRYYLFHLKLQDYLRQDESNPHKEYIFAKDEEETWHKRLTEWCERGGLSSIWQDLKSDPIEQGRREYARKYYITHLYLSRDWQRLFAVLDEGSYGRGKVRYDPSGYTYVQDVQLGRYAAAWEVWTAEESIGLLPYLWRYTLLQCSLNSRANSYTLERFDALLTERREQEALGLAQLLTDLNYQVKVLLLIARQFGKQQGQEREALQLLIRADEVSRSIKDSETRTEVLVELGNALVRAREWARAEAVWAEVQEVASTIQDSKARAEVLSELGGKLAEAQQWARAEAVWAEVQEVASTIQDSKARAEVLVELGKALVRAQQWARAEEIAFSIIDNIKRAEVLSVLGRELTKTQQWAQAEAVVHAIGDVWMRTKALSELARELVQAQQWARAEAVIHTIEESKTRSEALFELGGELAGAQQWELAEVASRSIEDRVLRTRVLSELGAELARAQQWKQAETLWAEAEVSAHSIEETEKRSEGLSELGTVLARAQRWERAEALWAEAEVVARSVEGSEERGKALRELGRKLAQAQQWERAEVIVHSIDWNWQRTEALQELTDALATAGENKRLLRIVQSSWLKANVREEAIRLLPLANGLIPAKPEIGTAFYEAFTWADTFLRD